MQLEMGEIWILKLDDFLQLLPGKTYGRVHLSIRRGGWKVRRRNRNKRTKKSTNKETMDVRKKGEDRERKGRTK